MHALAGTKRGAHLALSLERLDALVGRVRRHASDRSGSGCRPRSGRPSGSPPTSADRTRYHGRPAGGEVLGPRDRRAGRGHERPRRAPRPRPVESPGGRAGADPGGRRSGRTWRTRSSTSSPAHRSTIVFANSRRLAERLTSHLNELHAERLGREPTERGVAPPAQIMAQSGPPRARRHGHPVVARAHHGSVSKEQRAQIESDLKSGLLPCVVATSSLELGIDMGAVDVVVQVESPPSVASGLQRVGRAGHQVGRHLARGLLPQPPRRPDRVRRGGRADAGRRHRGGRRAPQPARRARPADRGHRRRARRPRSTSCTPWSGGPAASATCPTAPSRPCSTCSAAATPREDFAELRPRLVWQRDTGVLTARPGAQRLAVTSGGTIPDRGLFGVFLVGEGNASGRHAPGRRVGELDEEMVYETRVGDVFTLGTTSWRVEQITHDQVLVSPRARQCRAGCRSGRATPPAGRWSWAGPSAASSARSGTMPPDAGATPGCGESGLDEFAAAQPGRLPHRAAGGDRGAAHRPDDRRSSGSATSSATGGSACTAALGSGVLTPWALAVEHAARERYGLEVQATATNDGMVLRIPDTEAEPPGADLIVLRPRDTWRPIVTDEVGGSALFAARFRECAARALLLPRRDPKSRSPLWQQRMRSAQLLTVAAQYPEFPIVLETMRECLTDVFDLDGLLEVQRADRRAVDPAGRGRDQGAVAVRQVAAVRLRRRLRLRGRRPAGREEGRRACPWTPPCWPSCSARTGSSSCWTPASSPAPRPTCRASAPSARPRPSSSCSTCCAPPGPSPATSCGAFGSFDGSTRCFDRLGTAATRPAGPSC